MTDASRWLIVGLGNPEAEYGGTRHNLGADAVRLLASRNHASLSRNKRVSCEVAEIDLAGQRAVLCIPQSYMNTSGGPVQSCAAWYDVPVEQIIVLHDELDLDAAMLRTKRGGGHGGHNGLRDLDRALGSKDYLRVRIGIGKPPGRQPGADWVLRRPSPKDREELDVTLVEATECVETLIAHGLAEAQNRHNRGRSTP